MACVTIICTVREKIQEDKTVTARIGFSHLTNRGSQSRSKSFSLIEKLIRSITIMINAINKKNYLLETLNGGNKNIEEKMQCKKIN